MAAEHYAAVDVLESPRVRLKPLQALIDHHAVVAALAVKHLLLLPPQSLFLLVLQLLLLVCRVWRMLGFSSFLSSKARED